VIRFACCATAAVALVSSGCRSTPAAPPLRALLLPIPPERAPERFRVRFETTRGEFAVEAHRAWAPLGVDRFYQLAKLGYYDGTRFFRVVDGFMVQWGISGDTAVGAVWHDRSIPDDPVAQTNSRGRVTFATGGPNSRSTQLFVNYRDNAFLDARGFAPIGEVIDGMDVLDNLWRSYGEAPPQGRGPEQRRIRQEGEAYLAREFPQLEKVIRTSVEIPPLPAAVPASGPTQSPRRLRDVPR
jgi:peptidyl-prolyl cis-trans isomerase A (cyclophilin A)